MKVRIKYQQKYSMGIYTLIRIIELKPDNLIFKNRIKQPIVSTSGRSVENYMYHVREILNCTKEEILEQIQPLIDKHLMLPLTLSKEIRDYDIELDIEL